MTLYELVYKYKNKYLGTCGEKSIESVYKSAIKYLRNIFDGLGVSLSAFKDNKPYGYSQRNGYIINKELETIIENKLKKDGKFPSEGKIYDALHEPNALTIEIVSVVKCFLQANFTEEIFHNEREKIKRELERISYLFDESSSRQYAESVVNANYANEVRDAITVFIITNIFDSNKIDLYLCNIYRDYKKYVPSESPYLTEKELKVIEFLRLRKELKNIYNNLKYEKVISNLVNEDKT